MRLTSNTGLLAAIEDKPPFARQQSVPDLRCDVTPAPFMLRPYAGLYNPFSKTCSVLCNHPAHLGAKEHVRLAKDCCGLDRKSQPSEDGDKDKIKTPHDIVTEDMFRRYAETDSRPLTPAPTLASGKSRGSRRCLTPDHPFAKTAIVLDLRRSHSQVCYHNDGDTTPNAIATTSSGNPVTRHFCDKDTLDAGTKTHYDSNNQLKTPRTQSEQYPSRRLIGNHPPQKLRELNSLQSALNNQIRKNVLLSSLDRDQAEDLAWLEQFGLNLMIKQIVCDPSLDQKIEHEPLLKEREHNPPLTQREYNPPLKKRGKSQMEEIEETLLLSSLDCQADDLGNLPPKQTGNNPWLEQIGLNLLIEPTGRNPSLEQLQRNHSMNAMARNPSMNAMARNPSMNTMARNPSIEQQMHDPSIEHMHNPSLSSNMSQETLYYHGHTTSDMTAHNTSPTNERSTLPSLNLSEGAHTRLLKGQCQLPPLASPLVLSKRQVKEPVTVRTAKKTQLKSLNLGKPVKSKNKTPPTSHRSKTDKEGSNEAIDDVTIDEGEGDGDGKRRGKRRKKGRNGNDRLTSAGLAAQSQQDPETQIAGIGTDSQNPSSRGSVAPSVDDDDIILPIIKPIPMRKMMESFLDDDILKYLHREVDEAAIETEFDIKRRYVYEEALRTKPERSYGTEMQSLLKEMKIPTMSLGDWLHIPRVFSRQSAQFSLPLDSNALETLSPMNYAARFVNLKRSKQLLYLTVLRKFRDNGYRMPLKNIEEGLMLMMGGILTPEKAAHFRKIMEFDSYVEESCIPDEIKLTVLGWKRSMDEAGDANEMTDPTLKYRTWCGLCAICERMFGRFPPRSQDPPDGIELSDFSMVENRLAVLKVHKGLVEVLNTIRER